MRENVRSRSSATAAWKPFAAKPRKRYRKEAIAARIKADWPGGAGVNIGKIRQSHVAAWLASYPFGVPSYNLRLLFIREAFDLAVADRLLAESPVAGLTIKKAKKPIRTTPTFDEFQAIVADIRAMIHSAEAKDSGDFVEFIGLAGLGQAEASALTWGDVDFEKEQITTFRQKTKTGFAIPIYPRLLPLSKGSKRPVAGILARRKTCSGSKTPRRQSARRASGSGCVRTPTAPAGACSSRAPSKTAWT